jgi:hypothetical protein
MVRSGSPTSAPSGASAAAGSSAAASLARTRSEPPSRETQILESPSENSVKTENPIFSSIPALLQHARQAKPNLNAWG